MESESNEAEMRGMWRCHTCCRIRENLRRRAGACCCRIWRPIGWFAKLWACVPYWQSSELKFSTRMIRLPKLASKCTFLGFLLSMKARFFSRKRSLHRGAAEGRSWKAGRRKNRKLPLFRLRSKNDRIHRIPRGITENWRLRWTLNVGVTNVAASNHGWRQRMMLTEIKIAEAGPRCLYLQLRKRNDVMS